MTGLTHSCLRSPALLNARPSFTPFSRKAPLSRKFLAPVNQFHAPSWYPHLTPETFLVQVGPRYDAVGRTSSLCTANDAFSEWQLLYAVMLPIRHIILLTALITSLLWVVQHFTQVSLSSCRRDKAWLHALLQDKWCLLHSTTLTRSVFTQGQMGISTSAGKQDWSPSPGEQDILTHSSQQTPVTHSRNASTFYSKLHAQVNPELAASYADSNVQRKVSKSGYDITPLTQAQRDELAAKVDATTRHIALESGTERAFTGKTINGMFLAMEALSHGFSFICRILATRRFCLDNLQAELYAASPMRLPRQK